MCLVCMECNVVKFVAITTLWLSAYHAWALPLVGPPRPQPHTTPVPQLQTTTQAPLPACVTISPQSQQVQNQPTDLETFSKDMSNEQLALWLNCHPKLVGTDFSEDINKLRGITVIPLHHKYSNNNLRMNNVFRSENKWPYFYEFE